MNTLHQRKELERGLTGKPIYRKVVSYTNNSTIGASGQNTHIQIPHNIDNFQMCIDVKVATTTAYEFPTFNGQNSVSTGTCVSTVDDTNITLRIVNDTWASRTWYFILEYIKTTN